MNERKEKRKEEKDIKRHDKKNKLEIRNKGEIKRRRERIEIKGRKERKGISELIRGGKERDLSNWKEKGVREKMGRKEKMRKRRDVVTERNGKGEENEEVGKKGIKETRSKEN